MWLNIWNMFHEYMGTGLLVIWFLITLLYMWIYEEKKSVRIVFMYIPVIILLLYFNPLFAAVVVKILGDEIYYRILWIVPYVCVTAYGGVELWGRLRGIKQFVCGVCLICIFMLSGSYIYQSPLFHKAENVYHVPEEVVTLCDAIVIPGREVMAVFPGEILQYVRQYTPLVRMPYGREMLVERWNFSDPLYSAMEKETINVENLTAKARERMCHYIILASDRKMDGEMAEYDYVEYKRTQKYVIYKDTRVVLEIPELD